MNNNFKYAPGKPGIGTKGHDGSTGLQGLGMYFTDLDPVEDKGTINIRISSNSALWKLYAGSLPDGRSYSVGDLFVDQNGETYEITDTNTGTFSKIFANLSSGGFFLPLSVTTDDGFERYFNSNTVPKIIIDNVYTDSGAINYTASPLSIYGILPKNFARIEYSNVEINNRNPFTVYSSGISVLDDALSIAIVRETSGNTFRIGNLDNTGNLRNTNLTFDVSSLIVNRQSGNGFSANTPSGTILTNYEIAANSLFDPNFNNDPVSFVAKINSLKTQATINWTLNDFTNDNDVHGTFYFYQKGAPYSGIYSFDSSALKPLVITDVSKNGSVIITGLSGTATYECYMKLMQNGWTRNSITKGMEDISINVYPVSPPIFSSAAHPVEYIFDVSANSTWDVSLGATTWITGLISTSGGDLSHPFDGSFGFAIDENTGTLRHAFPKITVSGGGSILQHIRQDGP